MKKNKENKEVVINSQGSLGVLALGAIGIIKWREAMKAEVEAAKTELKSKKSLKTKK
ncbi:MAG: hypothetical protein RI883_1252 [Bacteroidota bacterium]|jgi:hypothetical protein